MDVYSKHGGKELYIYTYLVWFYSFGFNRKWKGLLGVFIILWTTTTFEYEPGWFMIYHTKKHSRKLSSNMWDSTTNSDRPEEVNKYGQNKHVFGKSSFLCKYRNLAQMNCA